MNETPKRALAALVFVGCGNASPPPPAEPVVVAEVDAGPAEALPPPDPPHVVLDDPRKFSFDPSSATSALTAVDLRRCVSPRTASLPPSMGHVTVVFDPSGRVQSAQIDGGPFPGTPEGNCLAHVFGTVTIPPFAGPPIKVGKPFSFP